MKFNENEYLIRNILAPIQDDKDLKRWISIKIKLHPHNFSIKCILKRSIDARNKKNIQFNYTVLISVTKKLKTNSEIQLFQNPEPTIKPFQKISTKHPFIIGTGPAGLFAALRLVESGFSPYLFEKGCSLSNRRRIVNHFWETGEFDSTSNVQFGEGGAGTFSDGKLTARSRDFNTYQIFDYLIKFGAPSTISYDALPHLGTDGFNKIIINLRKFLEANGCKFHFLHELTDLKIQNEQIKQVTINQNTYQPEIILLAIGNAARNTFKMLAKKIVLQAKPFAVGFRIEHNQSFLNKRLYGSSENVKILGNATYRMVSKIKNRGVYSFCMCPGGFVIGANSEKNQIVTNGMSYSDRNNSFGNSAIVVTVNENDFGSDPLSGTFFQEELEKRAYHAYSPYAAPIQKAEDFFNNNISSQQITSSYKPKTYNLDFNNLFPNDLSNALKGGLSQFDRKMNGFIKEGVLIGPETRTSSPLRMVRDPVLFHATRVKNLYPVGEGAGYAGGIISSATDGYKIASIFKN